MGFEDDFKGKILPDAPVSPSLVTLEQFRAVLIRIANSQQEHVHTNRCWRRDPEGCGEHHAHDAGCGVHLDCQHPPATIHQVVRWANAALKG